MEGPSPSQTSLPPLPREIGSTAPADLAGRMGQHIPGGAGRFPISGYLWINSGHLSGGGDSATASGVEEMS